MRKYFLIQKDYELRHRILEILAEADLQSAGNKSANTTLKSVDLICAELNVGYPKLIRLASTLRMANELKYVMHENIECLAPTAVTTKVLQTNKYLVKGRQLKDARLKELIILAVGLIAVIVALTVVGFVAITLQG